MPRTAKKSPIIPVSESPAPGLKPARKGNTALPSKQGLGSMAYTDKTLDPLFTQPIDSKQKTGRNYWADTSLVLVMRAKKAAQTYGKKDFNALYRLVLSAGIAFDKAFPTQVQSLGGNLVVQLFGSLGVDTAKSILEPARPILLDSSVSTPQHKVEAYLGETIQVESSSEESEQSVHNNEEPPAKGGDE